MLGFIPLLECHIFSLRPAAWKIGSRGTRTRRQNHSSTRTLSTSKKHFAAAADAMPVGKHGLAARYVGSEANVWVEFGALNAKHNTCNLGQGFPDMKHHSPPASVKAALAEVIAGDNLFFHQYTRSYGHPRLVNALAKLYGQLLRRTIDPMTDVLITVGAYGSLHAAVNGLVQPGDEVRCDAVVCRNEVVLTIDRNTAYYSHN